MYKRRIDTYIHRKQRQHQAHFLNSIIFCLQLILLIWYHIVIILILNLITPYLCVVDCNA